MFKKKISLSIIALLFTVSSSAIFASEASLEGGGDELHVCPGNGETCDATITYNGETIKVISSKTKGSGTAVLKPVQ